MVNLTQVFQDRECEILKEKGIVSILVEEMDEDILKKMPNWFKILRESYIKRRRPSSLCI